MKYSSALILFLIASNIVFAQDSIVESSTKVNTEFVENLAYKLFPTDNHWTFIKLNTRNGKMWQVHFTVSEEGMGGEVILNSVALVDFEYEVNGRFNLYPTENMYNFILLDQIDGNAYQVQWSMEEKYRGVFKLN